MEPRTRKSPPELLDLSDSAIVEKYEKDSQAGMDLVYANHLELILNSEANALSGSDAIKLLQKTEHYVLELAGKCTSFCPHISQLPFSKPHFWVPAFKAVICGVCVPEWRESCDLDNDCDLCGSAQIDFMEMNIQMGTGVLVFHLGRCCVDKFIPNKL